MGRLRGELDVSSLRHQRIRRAGRPGPRTDPRPQGTRDPGRVLDQRARRRTRENAAVGEVGGSARTGSARARRRANRQARPRLVAGVAGAGHDRRWQSRRVAVQDRSSRTATPSRSRGRPGSARADGPITVDVGPPFRFYRVLRGSTGFVQGSTRFFSSVPSERTRQNLVEPSRTLKNPSKITSDRIARARRPPGEDTFSNGTGHNPDPRRVAASPSPSRSSPASFSGSSSAPSSTRRIRRTPSTSARSASCSFG